MFDDRIDHESSESGLRGTSNADDSDQVAIKESAVRPATPCSNAHGNQTKGKILIPPRMSVAAVFAGASRRAYLTWIGKWFWAVAATMATSLPAIAHSTMAAGPSFYDGFSGMRLLDQNGQPMQLHDLRGKAVVFNFIFTTCSSVCPVQTHDMVQMLAKLAPDVRRSVHFVSVSLDPLSDTPQALKVFARRFKADVDNWSFLTGRPQDIERLAEALWLFQSGKGKAPLDTHSSSLWLVDPQGTLRVRHSGNPLDAARVGRELAQLAAPGTAPVSSKIP